MLATFRRSSGSSGLIESMEIPINLGVCAFIYYKTISKSPIPNSSPDKLIKAYVSFLLFMPSIRTDAKSRACEVVQCA